jgi:endonuclease I
MKKILKVLSLLPSFFLVSFAPAQVKNASGYDGKAYDTSTVIDLTDSTVNEINAYYGDVGSQTGSALMSTLYTTISTDNYFLNYGSGLSDVGKWYQITDRNWSISDPVDPATFKFIDSGKSADASSFYLYNMYMSDAANNDKNKAISNAVNGYSKDTSLTAIDYVNYKKPNSYIQVDKEHVWAKNHGFKVTETDSKGKTSDVFVKGAPTDLHHLVAADHNTNSAGHNDYMYGEVDHSTAKTIYSYLADDTTEISGWLDTSSETFEPTDEWKGDIARCLFYMATRYSNKLDQNTQAEPYLYITDDKTYTDDNNTTFHGVQYNLSTLLSWNEADPVSNYEIHRNNLIYKNVQKNRNPYIDHPEWVRRVYDVNYVYDAADEKQPTTTGTDTPENTSSNTSSNTGSTTSSNTNTNSNTSSSTTTSSNTSTGIPIVDFLIDKGVPLPIIIAIVVVLVIIVIVLIFTGILGSKKKKKRRNNKRKK